MFQLLTQDAHSLDLGENELWDPDVGEPEAELHKHSWRAEVTTCLLKQQHDVININESSFSLVLFDCFNLHPGGFTSLLLFFIQVEGLQFVKDQLFFSGLSSEVQPLPSETSGPEHQWPSGSRTGGSVWFSGESRLQTGDSEVRHHVLVVCWDEDDVKVVLTLNCRHQADLLLIHTDHLTALVSSSLL